jgi:hypothetical protein
VTEQPTPLTRSDAYLLAAASELNGKRPSRLRDLIANYDWLERGIPTFDEISFGFPRLIAAGFLEVGPSDTGEFVVHVTPKARALRSSITTKSRGGFLGDTAVAIGAAPYPEPETEDRSRGRVPGLDTADWEAEVRAYHESSFTGLAKFLAAGSAVVASVAVAAGIVRRRRKGGD